MPKKQSDTKEPTTTHGGFRWSKPAELKHIRVNIMLSPETIKLLEPYTRTGQRSKIIDAAVQEFLKKQKG